MKQRIYRSSGLLILLSQVLLGCSHVSLNYTLAQLPSSVTDQSRLRLAPASPGQQTVDATLRLKPKVNAQAEQLASLHLRVRLVNLQTLAMQELNLTSEQLLNGNIPELQHLPEGQYQLTLQLLDASQLAVSLTPGAAGPVAPGIGTNISNASAPTFRVPGEVLSEQTQTLVLNGQNTLAVEFSLNPNTGNSGLLISPLAIVSSPESSFPTAPGTRGTGLLAGQNPVAGSNHPGSTVAGPIPAGPGQNSPGQAGSNIQGSVASTTPGPSNLRVVNTSSSAVSLLWEAPSGTTVKGYRVYRNGVAVADVLSGTFYSLEGLNPNQDYHIEVSLLTAEGESQKSAVQAHTLNESTGGGGGGGGGGGTSALPPALNNPPVIQSLTASKTTLPGVKAPVVLNVLATDEQTLPASAYNWSCDACGDAVFSTNQGTSTVWTAPSTPGTYTLKVQVTDGVNPPVERTQQIVVNQLFADVIVNGEYQ